MVAVLLLLAVQVSDSTAHAQVLEALRGVEDSLNRVRGAAFNFRTDLGGASAVVVYGRAQRMHASCVAADRALARLDSVLIASYPKGAPGEGASLRRDARGLRTALAECRREYDTTDRWAQRADSVRAWARYRLQRLDAAARRFTLAAGAYRRSRSGGQKGDVGRCTAVDSQLHIVWTGRGRTEQARG